MLCKTLRGAPEWHARLQVDGHLTECSCYSRPDCVSFTAVLATATPK